MIPGNLRLTNEEESRAHNLIYNIDAMVKSLREITHAEAIIYHLEYKLKNRSFCTSRGFADDKDPITVNRENSEMLDAMCRKVGDKIAV